MEYILAFDIERYGATSEYNTLAIGAVVMDTNFCVKDCIRICGYMYECKFEPRCWEEFWSNKQHILQQLKYDGHETADERQVSMIDEFQRFRRKWELKAHDLGYELHLVSDHPLYDGGFLNEMIQKYRPDLPMPFSALKPHSYMGITDVDSMVQGILYATDLPNFDKLYLDYNVPKPCKITEHLPDDDAYSIAYDYCVCLKIKNKKLKRKSKLFKYGLYATAVLLIAGVYKKLF